MSETLLRSSTIHLYGRVLVDISLSTDDHDYSKKKAFTGKNRFLREQLTAGSGVQQPKFARIYGFAYEGHHYDLNKPAIFLVHGDGLPAESIDKKRKKAARAPGGVDRTGLGSQYGSFPDDIHVWEYDQADFSLRMDVISGPLEEILLAIEMQEDGAESHYSGARVSGARVSGARVSGARVSGARVSGARVSGARMKGGD